MKNEIEQLQVAEYVWGAVLELVDSGISTEMMREILTRNLKGTRSRINELQSKAK